MNSKIEIAKCAIVAFRRCHALANGHGWRRIHHVHIQKTGGTSVNQAIIAALAQGHESESWYSSLFPYPHSVVRNNTVLSGWNTDLMRVVRPHFSFAHTPLYNLHRSKSTFMFTVLRDPVRRAISEFFYHRQLLPRASDFPEIADSIMVASESATVAEWLGYVGLSANAMTNMFSRSGDVDEATDAIKSLNCVLLNPLTGMIDLVPLINQFPRLELKSERVRPSTPSNFKTALGSIEQVREILSTDIALWQRVSRAP